MPTRRSDLSRAAPSPGLGTLLRALLERLDGDVDRLYGEAGVEFRPRYFPVARLLLVEPRAPLSRIAAAAGVTHSAASQTVAEMARRGLVVLRPSAVDGRERLVALTAKGRRACETLAPLWAATARAASELDAELAAPLAAVAAQALDALERRPFAARVRDALAAAERAPEPAHAGEPLDAP
jgi:DNA-binding MarR family transcriptional regulator